MLDHFNKMFEKGRIIAKYFAGISIYLVTIFSVLFGFANLNDNAGMLLFIIVVPLLYWISMSVSVALIDMVDDLRRIRNIYDYEQEQKEKKAQENNSNNTSSYTERDYSNKEVEYLEYDKIFEEK